MRLDQIPAGLRDARGGKVVFVSHCLLNQNVRYLGGAFRSGAVDEVIDLFRRDGIGICQLRCPEQTAWGGVFKRLLLVMFGSRGKLRHRFRRPLLALFRFYTRLVYRRLARETVRQIEDYVRLGFGVVGMVGVADSPSCGVHSTVDLAHALDAAADVPLAALTRGRMNEGIVGANVIAGEGLFVAALRRELRRRHLRVSFLEIDSASAMRGAPVRLREGEETHA